MLQLAFLRLLDENSIASISFLPGTGAPISTIGDIQSTESALTAGPGGVFIMPLAVLGAVLSVELNEVAMVADRKIASAPDGSLQETLDVTLGGSLKESDLEAAILAMPDSAVERAGLTRQDILGIIAPLLEEDLGSEESADERISIGLTMEAIRLNPWDEEAGQFGPSTGLAYALCTAEDEGLACDDGNPCTLGDACLEGECVPGLINVCECGTDADCAEGDDLCDGVDRCGPNFTCQADPATAPAPCDTSEDTDCAANVCEPTTGQCQLLFTTDGMLCEDDDPCWTVKACEAGECEGMSWNPATCEEEACIGLVETACDDGVPCTIAICTSESGCSQVNDHSKCDDGDPCTADSCDAAAGDASGCTHEELPPQACSD